MPSLPFSDNFNRADVMPIGSPYTQVYFGPVGGAPGPTPVGITGNQAYCGYTVGYSGRHGVIVDVGSPDVTIELDLTDPLPDTSPGSAESWTQGNGGHIFRCDYAAGDFWHTNYTMLTKVSGGGVAGSWNLGAYGGTLCSQTGGHMKMTVVGSTIKMYDSTGTVFFTLVDSFGSGNTWHGFNILPDNVGTGHARIDNFSIVAASMSKWTVGYIGFGGSAGTWTPTGTYPATTLYPSTTLYPQGV